MVLLLYVVMPGLIMFGFLVPSYSPDACLSNCKSQQGKHITALRSSDLNCKQMTPSDLFTHTLTNYLMPPYNN